MLTPHEADLSADIDRMIDEAVAVSREGGLPTRTWRALTGGEVDEAIQPKISYDQDAVDHFVAHIAGNIDRDAVDASVEPSGGKLVPVAVRAGSKIDEDTLRKRGRQGARGSGRAHRQGRRREGQARGHHRRGRRQVPDLPRRRPLQLHAEPLTAT